MTNPRGTPSRSSLTNPWLTDPLSVEGGRHKTPRGTWRRLWVPGWSAPRWTCDSAETGLEISAAKSRRPESQLSGFFFVFVFFFHFSLFLLFFFFNGVSCFFPFLFGFSTLTWLWLQIQAVITQVFWSHAISRQGRVQFGVPLMCVCFTPFLVALKGNQNENQPCLRVRKEALPYSCAV